MGSWVDLMRFATLALILLALHPSLSPAFPAPAPDHRPAECPYAAGTVIVNDSIGGMYYVADSTNTHYLMKLIDPLTGQPCRFDGGFWMQRTQFHSTDWRVVPVERHAKQK